MQNRLPTGPGSRGGHWHDVEWRRAYHRAWRAAHPEYREREALRQATRRALARGDEAPSRLAPGRLPEPASTCACGCDCAEPVVLVCGFCIDGMHGDA